MTTTARRFMAKLAEYPEGALGPHELCVSCVTVLAIDRAAITIGGPSSTWEPLGASDDIAAHIEARQAIAGEGPAIDAALGGGPVLVDDLTKEFDRWPGFAAALGEYARGAMFAFPLQIGAIALGVLDLYRAEPVPLESGDMSAMLTVADITTSVLLSRAPDPDRNPDEQWWAPSPTSSQIHQATGMVVAQLAVPPHIAYLRLRAHAFANDKPLDEVAREVIERRLRFEPDEEG